MGMIYFYGTKLPMKLELKNADGNWQGAMLDPTVAGRRMEMNAITFDGQKLHFEVEVLGITFDGVQNGKQVKGVFNQYWNFIFY